MLEQVFDKLHEVSISRALKTEAELHALQNQINPHFLYNTLEIIRSRAMRRGSEDVAEMAEALGMLFRYCINSPGELATLAQELDNVHHYLLIQRYRYGDRFTYEEHIENEDVMDSSLPVMTLQPLVENALSHGINRRIDGGKITMRVESVGSRLQISVEDNGVGIAEDELRRVRKSLRERSGPIERRADSSRSTGIAPPYPVLFWHAVRCGCGQHAGYRYNSYRNTAADEGKLNHETGDSLSGADCYCTDIRTESGVCFPVPSSG